MTQSELDEGIEYIEDKYKDQDILEFSDKMLFIIASKKLGEGEHNPDREKNTAGREPREREGVWNNLVQTGYETKRDRRGGCNE